MMFSSLLSTAQVTYVNRAAAGMNNGTSWANAYQSLTAAMRANTTAGKQIWVAAGTYKPDTISGFLMSPGVQLFGGFAGTEANLSQRNPLTNITILSGDITGDDVAGNFTMNRADNSLHVIWVRGTDTISQAVIDGFNIRNGQTKATSTTTPDVGRGGGVFTQTKAAIRNCVFTANGGFNGAAIAATGAGASSAIVRNCVFDGNFTGERSIVYFQSLRNGQLRRCTFQNNTTGRGSFMAEGSRNIIADSCLFTRNKTTGTLLAPGIYTLGSAANITNCTFTDNKAAGSCGAIWLNGADIANLNLRIANCTFERDTSLGFGGGGIYASGTAIALVENCTFNENRTASGGGAIFGGFKTKLTIKNCNFNKNVSGSSGGCIFAQNEETIVLAEDCQFTGNLAQSATSGFGGVMLCGFRAQATLNRCTFTKNTAGGFGGALQIQSDSTKVTINDCTFTENIASASAGGAIHLTGGPDLEINKSAFSTNTSGLGGVLALRGTQMDPSVAKIDRCTFSDNNATTQGGALDIQSAVTTRISNSIFSGNIGENGAAISNNASASDTSRLTLLYCTIVENIGGAATGIVQYEDTTSSKCILTLQNTIISNSFGDSYVIEKGTPVVISNGGNLCLDGSMITYLTGINDLNNTDPKLSFTYRLLAGSPCIDKGIAVPGITTDLAGNARGAKPDMGSYEFQSVSTFETPVALRIEMTPNPAVNEVRLYLDNDSRGTVLTDFFDATGKLIGNHRSEKTAGEWQVSQSVANWPTGIYQVRVRVNGILYGGTLVKE